MRLPVELSLESPKTVDEIEGLIAPAVETSTGELLVEPLKDDILLERAVAIRDALDGELAKLMRQMEQRSKKVTGESDAVLDNRLADFRRSIGLTATRGWTTAYEQFGQRKGIVRLDCNWLQDVTRTMIRNRPLEIEVANLTTARPFAWTPDAMPSYNKAVKHLEPGLAIGALLGRIQALEYVRPVITVNDTPQHGSSITKEAMSKVMVGQAHDMLIDYCGISQEAQPGKDFTILPYSKYTSRYEELICHLEDSEAGFIARYSDGRVYLRPSDRIRQSVNQQYSKHNNALLSPGVLLRNTDGSASEVAIHATTFINPINRHFTHLRLHSRYLNDLLKQDAHPVGSEQDVSAILQAIDISHPDRDHNIYYDHRLGPERIVYAFAALLRREVQNVIDSIRTLNPVEQTMKPKDYFEHNYTDEDGMWPEDQQGVAALAAELPLHYAPGDIESAAVIGYGPFSYPALGIAAFMKEDGTLDISDLLPSNIEFAKEWFDGTAGPNHLVAYKRFADRFKAGKKSGRFYQNCEGQLRRTGKPRVAALEDLLSNSAQVIVESFVSCSNNIEKYGFYETIRQKARIMTWNSRSMMISVHMVESGGWNNSGDHEGVTIPAARLTIDELEDGYRSAGLRIIKSVPLRADAGLREDYNGMLLVFAKPDTIDRPSSLPQ